MKKYIVYALMGILTMIMAGCAITVSPGYVQEGGIYGYAFYYFPAYGLYYSPDLNRFWWYQGGMWQYAEQLPPGYIINPDAYYVVINSRSANPTQYNNYYHQAYERGDYRNRLQRVGEAPAGRLPFYQRPSDQGREPGYNQQNPNYDNNGRRKEVPSQTPGSRQPGQYQNPPQNNNNEGVRRNAREQQNNVQQRETRQQSNEGRQIQEQQRTTNEAVNNRQYQKEQPQRYTKKQTPKRAQRPARRTTQEEKRR
ncbi:hypothetical protein [Microbacter margulisiae]|uniref:Lipoprotein n=1 Tax=Microbacter margulisiae TaxID=1350067 RepID=A0A7W5DT17_9PORP|nr:hypothetical protein [Microbacter margulisiae]MBB3188546.1 hypothetical protein [Microbacter margulisiae]